MAALRISRNADGTWTVRVGRAVEHVDGRTKTKPELFDALLWAARSKGASITTVGLTEILYQATPQEER